MSFVKGQTTWSNIVTKLVALACGEVSDDAGATVRVEDRWVRMGVPTDNALRSPLSRDIPTGELAGRAGYFNATSSALRTVGGQAPAYLGYINTAFVRVVNVFTQKPPDYRQGANAAMPGGYNTTLAKRWMVNIYAEALNNQKDAAGNYINAGDYSTTKWRARFIDGDNGYVFFEQGGVAADALGYVQFVCGLRVQVGNPNGWVGTPVKGVMPAGVIDRQESFFRMFTGADAGGFMGGIDYWPNLWRASGTPTWGVAPTGVQGTDWALCAPGTTDAQYPAWLHYSYYIPGRNRFSWGLGLGIKTDAGCTGARYTVSWNMSKFMFRLFPGAGAQNGLIFLQTGLIDYDNAHAVRRYNIHGHGGSQADGNGGTIYDAKNFLKPFNVAGSVDPNAPIQYWMRVTAKCIVIALNADPGFTGTTTTNWVVELDSYPNQIYKDFNHIFGINHHNGYASQNVWVQQHGWQSHWYQNGLHEGTRDYQKGWMRTDLGSGHSEYAGGSDYWWANNPRPNETAWTSLQAIYYNNPPQSSVVNYYGDGNSASWHYGSPVPGYQAHPDPHTGKWALYSYGFHDGYTNNFYEGGGMTFRGYLNCGVYYLPGYNWATGDELDDQSPGGERYFLFSAHHYGTSLRGGGGLAISTT